MRAILFLFLSAAYCLPAFATGPADCAKKALSKDLKIGMTADLITRLCRSTESTAPVDCAIQVENSSLRALMSDEQIIRL